MSRYRRYQTLGGSFFFTVNLANRQSRLLVEQIALLRSAYGQVQQTHPFETIAICVLPNHLHAIWRLPQNDSDYSWRWSLIKKHCSSALPASPKRSTSKITKREKGIWQRRFWEHQIRDESDLTHHIQYVHFNPVKHGLVQDPKDWPFSSYHRWLKNQHNS